MVLRADQGDHVQVSELVEHASYELTTDAASAIVRVHLEHGDVGAHDPIGDRVDEPGHAMLLVIDREHHVRARLKDP